MGDTMSTIPSLSYHTNRPYNSPAVESGTTGTELNKSSWHEEKGEGILATWTHHRQFAVFNECLFRSGSSLFWWQCCCLLSTEEQRYKTYTLNPQSSSRCLSICFCSKEHLQHLIGGYRDPQSLTPQNSKSLN